MFMIFFKNANHVLRQPQDQERFGLRMLARNIQEICYKSNLQILWQYKDTYLCGLDYFAASLYKNIYNIALSEVTIAICSRAMKGMQFGPGSARFFVKMAHTALAAEPNMAKHGEKVFCPLQLCGCAINTRIVARFPWPRSKYSVFFPLPKI